MASNDSINELSILESYLLTPSPLTAVLPYSAFLTTCVPSQYRTHPHIKRLYRDIQFQRDIDVDAVRQNIERECARAGQLQGRLAAKIAAENDPSLQPAWTDTNGPGNSNGNRQRQRKRKHDQVETEPDKSSNAEDNDDQNHDHPADPEGELVSTADAAVDTAMMDATLHPAAQSLPQKATQDAGSPLPISKRYHTLPSLLAALNSAIETTESEIRDLEHMNAQMLAGINETVGGLSDLRYGRFARPSGGVEGDTMENDIVNALKQFKHDVEMAVGEKGG